jgi:plastocyanin
LKRIALVLIPGLLLALLLAACGSDDPAPPTGVDSPAPPEAASAEVIKAASQTIVGTETESGAATVAQDGCEGGTSRTVALQDPGGSGEYMFDPSALSFKKGECVNFTFTSESEFHTFTVEALDLDVSVDGGASENVAFTFDVAGEYELVCVPHELLGMVGTITVSE